MTPEQQLLLDIYSFCERSLMVDEAVTVTSRQAAIKILDLFSRYNVGMTADRKEHPPLAQAL